MDLSLLISTVVMLKQCTLKDYLFKIVKKINKLSIQNYFNESIKYNLDKNITEDIIEDINIILENMDDWIRNYNTVIKRELMSNLGEIKKMFYVIIKH